MNSELATAMLDEDVDVVNATATTEEQTTVIPWMEMPTIGFIDQETGEVQGVGCFVDDIAGDQHRDLVIDLFRELNITTLGELRASWDKVVEAKAAATGDFAIAYSMIDELILTFADHYDDSYVGSWMFAWPEFFPEYSHGRASVFAGRSSRHGLAGLAVRHVLIWKKNQPMDDSATSEPKPTTPTDGPLPDDWRKVYDRARELVEANKELFSLNHDLTLIRSNIDTTKAELKEYKAEEESVMLKISAKIKELEALNDPGRFPLLEQPADRPPAKDEVVVAETPSTDGPTSEASEQVSPATGDESADPPMEVGSSPAPTNELTPEIRATPLAELTGWKPSKLAKLQEAGVDTIGDLLDFQIKHGEWWTKEIKGFGETGHVNCCDVMEGFWAGRRSQ